MKILCLHQSAELYGSDRSFLQVIKYLKSTNVYSEICVVIPGYGPLVDELNLVGVKIKYVDLTIVRKTYLKRLQFNKIFVPLLFLRNKFKLFSAYDIIYVNTSVILDFYILSPFLTNKKILHIREIPRASLSFFLSYLCRLSNAEIIFNSVSTRKAFKILKKVHIIYNAFEGFGDLGNQFENDCSQNELKLLLIGRINTWKGHSFVLDALSKLTSSENVKLKIVGSTFEGNEHILDELKIKAKKLNLVDKVSFTPFTSSTFDAYNWADVVVVPSIMPEPFGRIAIEGMSLKKPVVAANHGGLPEIVSHDISGFLFTPSDVSEFISCIRRYYYNRELVRIHGRNAYKIFNEKFSVIKMNEELSKIFTGI